MGVFSDDEEEKKGRRDNPRYTGEATECAVCGRHFIIGDMLYVIKMKSGEAVVCYQNPSQNMPGRDTRQFRLAQGARTKMYPLRDILRWVLRLRRRRGEGVRQAKLP
ncbi:MAG: hypothetical protein HYT82_02870 [Candidatus Harrisonbacteria bacterium]|nr:hypothetical protein [Candidatus Harrisonbacteria bacterium]